MRGNNSPHLATRDSKNWSTSCQDEGQIKLTHYIGSLGQNYLTLGAT